MKQFDARIAHICMVTTLAVLAPWACQTPMIPTPVEPLCTEYGGGDGGCKTPTPASTLGERLGTIELLTSSGAIDLDERSQLYQRLGGPWPENIGGTVLVNVAPKVRADITDKAKNRAAEFDERFRVLKTLHENGTIKEEEYKWKRKQLLLEL